MNNIITVPSGKVWVRNSDHLLREGTFRLNKTEKKRDYTEYQGIEIDGKLYPLPLEDYSTLVSYLIHLKYPLDLEISLINNYILDSKTYREEYNQYSLWRGKVKLAIKNYTHGNNTELKTI